MDETPDRIRALYVQRALKRMRPDGRIEALVLRARSAGVRVEVVEREVLDRKADGAHQGVLLDCHEVSLAGERDLEAVFSELPKPRLILVLDGVTDPRNLGACLRSANGAGVHAVLLPKRRSAPLSGAALKAAAGGIESLFVVEVSNLARRLEWLKDQGVWLYGAVGEGDHTWSEMDYTGDCAIVVGSEEAGLRALTRKLCDHLVSLPWQVLSRV